MTERQLKILSMMADGEENQSIANTLQVPLWVVKSDVMGIFEELGAVNRPNAVAVAYRTGLLAVGVV
jgi:DNA-binding NarL/FixJ family response regulator